MIITKETLKNVPQKKLHEVKNYIGFTVCQDNGIKHYFVITSTGGIVCLNSATFYYCCDYDTIENFVIDAFDEYGEAYDKGRTVVEMYNDTEYFLIDLKRNISFI